MKPEALLRRQISDYLQLQYKWAIYRWDLGADLKLTPGQATRHKRLHPVRGYPDLFIAEPSPRPNSGHDKYHGLFLEIKADGVRLRKRDGSYASPHIEEQAEMLSKLEFRGYKAVFAVGFEEAKEMIDRYLGEWRERKK